MHSRASAAEFKNAARCSRYLDVAIGLELARVSTGLADLVLRYVLRSLEV
jgi:hypothetical protein